MEPQEKRAYGGTAKQSYRVTPGLRKLLRALSFAQATLWARADMRTKKAALHGGAFWLLPYRAYAAFISLPDGQIGCRERC
ncbi:hypothetical protein CRM93_08775 [Acetobacter fabarum]|uniref:Uncharacterized protein n=1 Tax=Acetobacter fabarum TaxID=483199 RepID=A0A269XZT4_9PROT|nr:hypothetical protein B8X00_08770 [Acetobacter fabarum]PEN25861.1 hypothetical protein CRM93_08775 [Acetobacter fabarum]